VGNLKILKTVPNPLKGAKNRNILCLALFRGLGEESPKVFLTPFNCAPKSPKGDFKDAILYI
jgi:hypothetical protein